MKFKIKKTVPLPGVICLKFQNQYECCSSFMRMQEFYESPFKEIRGKFFTLDKFMDLYAKQQGDFTYTSDWGGFNVPGHVVDQFYLLFEMDLFEKEQHLFDKIESLGEKYYVIGMCDETSLDHELAHALYYLNDGYFHVMDDLVKSLPKTMKEKIQSWLLEHGYSKPQVPDEIHAYLATESQVTLIRRFGKQVGTSKRIEAFRKAYEQHSGRKLVA